MTSVDELSDQLMASVARASGRPGGAPTGSSRFATALADLVAADQRVIAVDPATGAAGGLAPADAVTFAAGLAAAGRRPVVTLPAPLFSRCFAQFLLDGSPRSHPVVFVSESAGPGASDLALGLLAPDVAVYAPSGPADVGPALREAVARGSTAVVRLPDGAGDRLPGFDGPPGTARRRHQGDDLCLAAVGAMVGPAAAAAEAMVDDGIGVDLWDVFRVRPLDGRFLHAALAASTIVTVEDGVACGGAGSAIAHHLGEHGWRGHIRHLGAPDAPVPAGTQDGVRSLLGFDAPGIAAQCKVAIGSSKR